MKTPVLIFSAVLAISLPLLADDLAHIESPNGKWSAMVTGPTPLTVDLRDAAGKLLVSQRIRLKLAEDTLPAEGAKVAGVDTRAKTETIRPPVRDIAAELPASFNEATIRFDDKSAVVVRLYDDGLAYRFRSGADGELTVRSEERVCKFDGDPAVWFGAENNAGPFVFFSHNEVSYDVRKLSAFDGGELASQPLTVRPAGSDGLLVFSESALENYPGQWMTIGNDSINGTNPGYPAEETEEGDRNHLVTRREPFIAKTAGPRDFPWRTVAVAAQDKDLIGNAINYITADAPRISDTSWIQPGKAQWDWWHNWTWDGEEHPITNDTYKLYIDFAARHGIPYVILDEGWYELEDLTKQKPGIDVPELVNYGRDKGVGVILWATSLQMKKRLDVVMPMFEKWGVKGLKVDFFQRDDQKEIEFYWKLAKAAADRKLLLDFHGAHKPAGLERTYPNVLTFEGVRGLEQNKGGRGITPTHDLQLPFTRMVAGPLDYTPGAMKNAQPAKFKTDWSSPMSRGTRCHELAKYVVFESPLQMLCDAPPHYEREPETMQFLSAVPTTWDETIPLEGRIGEYAAVARSSGGKWFLAAMTNEDARDLEIDFSQLGAGDFDVEIWQDGPKAADDATDFTLTKATVKAGEKLPVKLAPSGGWVAIASPAR